MTNWPRLSAESLEAIERAERDAESVLGSHIRTYTPGNPKFRRTTDSLREGGYRVVEYVCGYAEILFDAFAKEYAKFATQRAVSRAFLKKRIALEVERRAWKAWGGWLVATSIVDVPTVGPAVDRAGDMRFAAPPELAGQGIDYVVIRWADKSPDPKLAAILLQLQQRFRTQLQSVLRSRVTDWGRPLPELVAAGAMTSDVKVPTQAMAGARRGYRPEVLTYMAKNNIATQPMAARKLGVSLDILKSIMTNKGKPRYGQETLKRVLEEIGYKDA
jgi:hypothetical protein